MSEQEKNKIIDAREVFLKKKIETENSRNTIVDEYLDTLFQRVVEDYGGDAMDEVMLDAVEDTERMADNLGKDLSVDKDEVVDMFLQIRSKPLQHYAVGVFSLSRIYTLVQEEQLVNESGSANAKRIFGLSEEIIASLEQQNETFDEE